MIRSKSFSHLPINDLDLILKRISLINFINQPLSLSEQKYWCLLNVADKAFIIEYLLEIIDKKQYSSMNKSIILIENTSVYELKKIFKLIKDESKKLLLIKILKADISINLWRLLRGNNKKFFVRNYPNVLYLFEFMSFKEIDYYMSFMTKIQREKSLMIMMNMWYQKELKSN